MSAWRGGECFGSLLQLGDRSKDVLRWREKAPAASGSHRIWRYWSVRHLQFYKRSTTFHTAPQQPKTANNLAPDLEGRQDGFPADIKEAARFA